jgi:hypothetical protein
MSLSEHWYLLLHSPVEQPRYISINESVGRRSRQTIELGVYHRRELEAKERVRIVNDLFVLEGCRKSKICHMQLFRSAINLDETRIHWVSCTINPCGRTDSHIEVNAAARVKREK